MPQVVEAEADAVAALESTILKHLLEPVLTEFHLRAVRADKIAKPGIITKQVIEYIDTADPYTIMDRVEAAKTELREHLTAVMKGTEQSDDNPINLFLPKLNVRIPK